MSLATLPDRYDDAYKLVVSAQRVDNSFLQRQLKIPYGKAQELVRALEATEVVSPENQKGQRRVLVKMEVESLPSTDPAPARPEIRKQALAAATEAAMGHNSQTNGADLLNTNDNLSETAREKLRLTVERIERLEEEKKEIAEQIKEVYGEAKALGYDTKALRSVVRLRKQDRQERQEQEAILEVYLDALGEL